MNKKGQVGIGGMEFSNLIMLIIFLVVTFVSGIVAGILYYDMQIIDQTLQTVNFVIPVEVNLSSGNNSITDFQDVLGVVVYPILGLRTSLPYLVYFLIFGLIIALGMTAYMSSKNPWFFVLHLLFLSLITYFSMILSGSYVNLLANPFINQIMTPFTIYNKIMIYLPQILFFTGLLFAVISFVNVIKPTSNSQMNQTSLNYGGDY